MDTTFEELAGKYGEHLAVLNYSTATVKHRLFYLKRFFGWLGESGVGDLSGVTPGIVRDYQAHVYDQLTAKGEPLGVLTQNNALQAVKGFFRFLNQEDYVVADPTRNVTYAKRPKRLPRSILTAGEVKKMLEACDTHRTLGYRDRAILELMYSTGLRRDEVNHLTVEDVDYEGGFVRVNGGKGAKDRVVPLGRIACKVLEAYVKGVRSLLTKDPTRRELFLSLRGGRLSKNVIWAVVKRYARKAGLKKQVSPHTFRHTCATLMLKNRANLRHVQELLGHSSLNTTQIYTAVTVSDLKAIHRKCHPRENERGQA